MSAMAHFADSSQTFPEVREVPEAAIPGQFNIASYSIISSICASSVGETVRSSACAVFILMTT